MSNEKVEELRRQLQETELHTMTDDQALVARYKIAEEAMQLAEQNEASFKKVDVALRRLVRRIQGVDIYDNTPDQQIAYLNLTAACDKAVRALKNNQEGLKP